MAEGGGLRGHGVGEQEREEQLIVERLGAED